MNTQEHLLTCLSEECAEVSQRVSKALRFGVNEIQPDQTLSNSERIAYELSDLFAVVEMLESAGVLKPPLNPTSPAHHNADMQVTWQTDL